MTNDEFAAYKKNIKSNLGEREENEASEQTDEDGAANPKTKAKQPKAKPKGPGWKLVSPNITYGPDAPDTAADFRPFLQSQWEALQKKKGWDLGKEWKDEAANFRSPHDEVKENEERKQTVFE